MKNKNDIIYFLGIGGIGMSALARWFHSRGAEVYGYDAHPTPLTKQLEAEGMSIHYEPDVSVIPTNVDRVVYTPAIPALQAEFVYFREKGIRMMKRAEVLGEISRDLFTLAVAGTHGKTSITAMVAWILHVAQKEMVAFIGGIANNFNNNFVLSDHPQYMVVEADEFDRSFLTLHPDVAVVSSVDADHLDIYNDKQTLQETFVRFVRLLPPEGQLIHQVHLSLFHEEKIKRLSYGYAPEAQLRAEDVHLEQGRFCFDVFLGNDFLFSLRMLVPGIHYVENALAAIGMALACNISLPEIKKAMESFTGVQRRFAYRIRTPERVFIDDYAHHPEELRVTLEAIRQLYPGKVLTVVFQPHLYSRTRDFAEAFAAVLSMADRLILLDIYPAREKPIPGVTSGIILKKVTAKEKQIMSKIQLLTFLKKEKPELLLTAGAGDIGLMVNEIEKILRKP